MELHKTWIAEFKQAQAATVRALAADRRVAVGFGHAAPAQQCIPLPTVEPAGSALDAIRGAGDFIALRHRFHDAQLHARRVPRGNPVRGLYDWLEEARVAAIGARMLAGVATNLDAELDARCRRAFLDTVTSRDGAPLDIALGLLVREQLSGCPLPAAAENIAAFWREHVAARAGPELQQLEAYLMDQQGFGAGVVRLLDALDLLRQNADMGFPSTAGGDDETGADPEPEGRPSGAPDRHDAGAPPDLSLGNEITSESEALSGAGTQGPPSMPESESTPHFGRGAFVATPAYRVYTREFDRTLRADSLAEGDELTTLRQQLDRQLGRLRRATQRQAYRLQNRLLARQSVEWTGGLEEGMLDTARLATVVTRSRHAPAFRQVREAQAPDTVLTLLIDSSGSMRGHPIAVAAMCADILVQTLERCRVKVEILGFSTQDWRGGLARQRWREEGQAPQPGRLNDLLHVIYKQADEPWRRARRRLGMLLKEDLLKENIDGEALLWAHDRLLARPERRRLLMVVSDGLPMDTSTHQANGDEYLARHLSQTVDFIERHSPVELLAIGIGHDVGRFYRRAVTIRDVDQLGGAIFAELGALFDAPPPGSRAAGRYGERA